MRAKPPIRSLLIALCVAACAPAPPPPLDSPAFARRTPPPGQPGYLETIGYIADGLRYISPATTFFVSADGEMCFQGLPDASMNPYASRENYWCISPMAVGSVQAVSNDVTYVEAVRLWCRHSAPQCAHKIAYPNMLDRNWVANSITAETVRQRQERNAIRHLIYLMGGDIGAPAPLEFPRGTALDTSGRPDSVAPLTLEAEKIR